MVLLNKIKNLVVYGQITEKDQPVCSNKKEAMSKYF